MQMIQCQIGTYSLGGLVTNCTVCPAGYSCPQPSSAPIKCSGGMNEECQFNEIAQILSIIMQIIKFMVFLSLLSMCAFLDYHL